MRFLAIFTPIGAIGHRNSDRIMHRFAKSSVVLLLAAALSLGLITTSCSKKSGCPAEDAHVEMDKKGNYNPGKTKSGLGLVPKKGRKSSKN